MNPIEWLGRLCYGRGKAVVVSVSGVRVVRGEDRDDEKCTGYQNYGYCNFKKNINDILLL